jgi:hypothetical protein
MATFGNFAQANGVRASRGCGGSIQNTVMGENAFATVTATGVQNAAFGFQAMRKNTTGQQNTAVGHLAMYNNTTGVCNTAIGAFALYNSNGANNTAVGKSAGFSITTGGSNTLIGAYAGQSLTTGESNTAFGYKALSSITNTCWNTAIGHGALGFGTTGCSVGVGWYAAAFSNGNCNTFVGAQVGCNAYSASNIITISRFGTTSNNFGHTLWGNSGLWFNWIQCPWTNVSDCRDKTCIQDLDQKLGLTFLRKITPVSFKWDNREDYVRKCGFEYGQKDGSLVSAKKSYGFEAQQVKQVLEELETEFQALGYDEQKDAYRITYEEFIASLIKAVQETSDRLETLEAQVA